MATPPKRGRGRPPLTEAEKKRRADEEAEKKAKKKAEIKERQEKAYRQRLKAAKSARKKAKSEWENRQANKIQKNNEQLVLKEKQFEQLDPEKRTSDIEAYFAMVHWGAMRPINIENVEELSQRVQDYFEWCATGNHSMTRSGLILALGIKRAQFTSILNGTRRDGSIQQQIFERAMQVLENKMEIQLDTGEAPAPNTIFKAKNLFGWKDVQETVIVKHEDSLGDVQSAEQLAQKYQTNLPKEIDVEYREVDD